MVMIIWHGMVWYDMAGCLRLDPGAADRPRVATRMMGWRLSARRCPPQPYPLGSISDLQDRPSSKLVALAICLCGRQVQFPDQGKTRAVQQVRRDLLNMRKGLAHGQG